MRLLITRPEPGAAKTAEALRARGHDVLVDPMLDIVLQPGAALDPTGAQAIAATSANALRALAERGDLSRFTALPLFVVGANTASTARKIGFTEIRSADGTAEDLFRRITDTCDPAAGALLYAAGRDRVGDLEGDLAEAGYKVRLAELYRAETKDCFLTETIEALRAGALDGVLIYSQRTMEAVVQAAHNDGLADALRSLTIIAISDKAVAPAIALGCKKILVAARPTGDALIACLDQIA